MICMCEWSIWIGSFRMNLSRLLVRNIVPKFFLSIYYQMIDTKKLIDEYFSLDEEQRAEFIERMSREDRMALADTLEWPLLVQRARGGFTFDAFSVFFKRLHGVDLLEHWHKPLMLGFAAYADNEMWSQVIEA